jgi:hypothetical protein
MPRATYLREILAAGPAARGRTNVRLAPVIMNRRFNGGFGHVAPQSRPDEQRH